MYNYFYQSIFFKDTTICCYYSLTNNYMLALTLSLMILMSHFANKINPDQAGTIGAV